ncbi:hypothetical protein NDU88_003484 [Pleurodeles waltl]|uniref:Secreted protein n=1 Tax=Pleurodeles waltl TaxID=8319 RepID=A0AAV7LFE8_PLEWA|nr:hypothetical protein NDU88_003484 [Pleurodeles waltl]
MEAVLLSGAALEFLCGVGVRLHSLQQLVAAVSWAEAIASTITIHPLQSRGCCASGRGVREQSDEAAYVMLQDGDRRHHRVRNTTLVVCWVRQPRTGVVEVVLALSPHCLYPKLSMGIRMAMLRILVPQFL